MVTVGQDTGKTGCAGIFQAVPVRHIRAEEAGKADTAPAGLALVGRIRCNVCLVVLRGLDNHGNVKTVDPADIVPVVRGIKIYFCLRYRSSGSGATAFEDARAKVVDAVARYTASDTRLVERAARTRV